MRQAEVPIDMSSEQRNLMGVVSTRQAIYLGVGGVLLYSYVYPLFEFLMGIFGWMVALVVSAISALPVIAVVGFLGFFPKAKYNMPRDYYLFIYIQRANNVGLWRKGTDE
jgi:hypothetical protein